MGCVYRVTCMVNNKMYIGKTINTLEYRKAQHFRARSKKDDGIFHRALRKYGKDAFIWEEIFQSEDEDVLYDKETEFIILHNTLSPNGYNMNTGGLRAYSFCEEKRLKMKEYWQDADWKNKILTHRNEIIRSPEYRQKCSEIGKLRAQNPEWIQECIERGNRLNNDPSWKEKNNARALRLGKPVYCVELNEVFPTIGEASRKTAVNTATISNGCRKRHVLNYSGLHFCFANYDDMEELRCMYKIVQRGSHHHL